MRPEQIETGSTHPSIANEDYNAIVLKVQGALCQRFLHDVASPDRSEALMLKWVTGGRAERYRELVDSNSQMHALVEEYTEGGSADTLDKMLEMIDYGLKH